MFTAVTKEATKRARGRRPPATLMEAVEGSLLRLSPHNCTGLAVRWQEMCPVEGRDIRRVETREMCFVKS